MRTPISWCGFPTNIDFRLRGKWTQADKRSFPLVQCMTNLEGALRSIIGASAFSSPAVHPSSLLLLNFSKRLAMICFRHHPDQKIYFYKFPKDAETRQKWIASTKRKNLDPASYTVVWSAHFDEESLTPDSLKAITMPFHYDIIPVGWNGNRNFCWLWLSEIEKILTC